MVTTASPASGRYLEPDIELADRPTIEGWQQERLLESVERTLARSAFHNDLWKRAGVNPGEIQSVPDFTERAPAFVQDDVTAWAGAHGDPFGGLLCLEPHEVTFIGSTSGTTGTPMALPQYADNPRIVSSCRDMWEEGIRPGETILRTSIVSRHGIVSWSDAVIERLGLDVVTLDNNPANAAAVIEASERFAPVSYNIISRPMMAALEELARVRGTDLVSAFASYRAVSFGGEPLGADGQARLESWFSRVRRQTSLGNTIAAVECLEGDGCHTYEDLVYVEVVDPDTRVAVPEGQVGELVVTTLRETAMPLLRFATEDLVRYTSERCGCGRTHGRIWTLGRRGDGVKVAAQTVLPAALLPLLAQLPETSSGLFQLVVTSDTSVLNLRVGRTDGRSDAELAPAIAEVIYDGLGVQCEVELVANDALVSSGPGYKIQRVVREVLP
jgi:phenylacetate-CoA ligase